MNKGWEQHKLGKIMNVTSVKRIHQSDWQKVGIPFYRARDVVAISKGQKISEPIYISENKYKEFSEISGKVKINDLLVTGVGTIGVPLLVQKTPLYFKDGNIIWFQNNNQFNGIFLYNAFLTRSIQNFIKTTTGVGTVPTYTIITGKETPISFPKPKEQDRIATLLKTAENLITLQQRKLEQLKQLKKAMLQQLFVNKNNKQPILKFKNFRNNWREYKLSEIVNLEDNKRKPVKATERIRGKIPYYGANGIQDYVKGYTHIGKHVLIAEDGANSVDDYPIYFIYSPSWINNHTHVLTAKEEILSSEFLAYALKKINYAKYLVGSGRYKLNAEILKLIPLKIPTMNEQKYIESNLSKIDKLIILQQNKLTQLTTLKRYLLQKLFI
ncbi:restriction endonuclease subunit S [Limosilactobacillus reuteri]|uniref:restriction endonuclease subunit S n=1 Tax=Limosilactobacillus reuteri TaxID=1598 RepID=UPI001CDAD089|nr:restriction endonuclease subunit S [Limosilactobacillus reuteri]